MRFVPLSLLCAVTLYGQTPIYNGLLQSDLNAAGFKINGANLIDYAGTNVSWNVATNKFDVTGGVGTVTSITATAPIVVTPSPLVGTGVISITSPLSATFMPAFTGDVTTSSGAVATTIGNSKVTYAKMQNVSANSRLLGAGSAGTGLPPAEITVGSGLTMTGTTLTAAGGGGTVTNTGGNLTANSVVLGAGTVDTKVVPGVITDGTSKLTLGVSTTSVGSIALNNLTSGSVTIAPATGALSTATMTIPAGASNPVIADTGAASNFLTAISSAGVISKARPAIATLSDAGTLATWAAVTPGTNVTTFLTTPSSANLRGALTDENGTGASLFSGATAPAFVGITMSPTGGTTNSTINFGANFDAPALMLYDNGTATRSGWALRASEMQFFTIAGAHYSWNTGGDIQPSGTNEMMRLFAGGGLTVGSTTDPGTGTINASVGYKVAGAAASRKILVGDGTKYTTSTETWAVPGAATNFLKSDGTNWTAAQPAFSSLSGSATAAQMPAYTGDVTSVAGATANTLVNIPATTTIAGVAGTRGDVLYYGASGWAKLGAGTSGNQLTTNGAGADPTWAAPGSGGSGSPGGLTTQVQFNDAGAFGGDANMTWDKTNHILNVAGSTTTPTLRINTLEFQGYGLNNAWIGENAYYNAGFFARATGKAGLFYFFGDEGQFRFYGTTTAGGTLPGQATFKVNTSGAFAAGSAVNATGGNYATSLLLFNPATTNLKLPSNYLYAWSSTGDANDAADTGVARNAAGIVEVNNGTIGSLRDIVARTHAATVGFQINGTAVAADYINSSVSSQSPAAVDVYVAGSNVVVPANAFAVKGQYRCLFDVTKTAGTGGIVISVRVGTAGTTADTAQLTFTFPAGTSVADVGTFEVFVNWRTVGTGTSAVIEGVCRAAKNNVTAAGLWGDTSAAKTIVAAVSSGFASTTFTNMGVSFNGGTAFAGTVTTVQASLQQ